MKLTKLCLVLFLIPFLYSNIFSATVSGIVTDSINGNAVAGARLVLMSNNPAEPGFNALSNENGFYQFTDVTAGTYLLVVYADGYNIYFHPNSLVLDANSNLTINIQLMPAGFNTHQLSGKVTDAVTNEPIAEAWLMLQGTYTFPLIAETDAQGNYLFPVIEEGTYELTCSKMFYNTFEIQNLAISQNTVLDISLTPQVTTLGKISGRVTKDIDGTPIQNAIISLIALDPVNSYYFRELTDENGNYLITAPAGQYYVMMTITEDPMNAGYFEYYDDVHSLDLATVVTVIEDQTVPNINFGVPEAEVKTITLNGKVTDEFNVPIENALVTVHQNFWWADSINALTSSDGSYSLSFTAGGFIIPYEFIVVAEKEGFLEEYYLEKSSFFDADIISVVSDTVINNVNFTLAVDNYNFNNSISGKVTNENAEPIADAMVIAFSRGTGNNTLSNFSFTDASGNYQITGLANVDYYIYYNAPGYISEFFDNVYTWEEATPLLADGNIGNINAVLAIDSSSFGSPASGLIVGIVKDENGNTLANTLLTLKSQNGTVIGSTVTSSTGYYSINANNPNNYVVVATKLGYESQTSSFLFNPQHQTTYLLNFNLHKSVTSVKDNELVIPLSVQLSNNYPNPFNPSTVIKFSIPENQKVKLNIYNALGQKVKELLNGELSKGSYAITWDATDNNGLKVTSGIYFYALETSNVNIVKKMVLTK